MSTTRTAGIAAGALLAVLAPALRAQEQAAGAPEQADLGALAAQLQALKADYAKEVRRLRELDVQVQALQARLGGRLGNAADLPAQPLAEGPEPPVPRSEVAAAPEGTAGSRAEASRAEHGAPTRSLQDALQQEHAVFDRKLTIENGINYAYYDRKQLTLNGFLALDAIFLGNIALQDVKSNTLAYTFAARYGLSPRLTLNLEVPYLARHTSYFQGGAGGSASAIAEESTRGTALGDVTLSANYRLFYEGLYRPDTVLTFGVTAPTGRSPYGIDWKTPKGSSGDGTDGTDGSFAVPDKQPTGNGQWQASLGVSAVKTMDPAIVFANLGYVRSFARSYGDLDTSPQTRTPGDIRLGAGYYAGAGVAFAFNERTSLSLSFSDRLNEKASVRYPGSPWARVIGSDANAASFNLGVTYAMSPRTTLVTLFGIGLTPDAPNFNVTFKIPYMF